MKWLIAVCVSVVLTGCTAGMTGRASGEEADVLVYGATPGGIAAAVAAAKDGRSVVLVEPTIRIGGMMTNGLTHTDIRTWEGMTGSFADFAGRVVEHYAAASGPNSEDVKLSLHGTQFEPGLALSIFQRMLDDRGVRVITNAELAGVQKDGRRITGVSLRSGIGSVMSLRAKVFIDGTYEGDLLAKAGVAYRVGREGREEYGESLAPEKADGELQAYNFRLTMTQREDLRVAAPLLPGYNRADYLPLLEMIEKKELKGIFGLTAGYIYKAQHPTLPRGKFDINDISHGNVRLSLPGEQLGWPEGDAKVRKQIFDAHLRHDLGMLYFLQNDPAVPAKFRDEARGWGLCRDEYPENDHIAVQIYVREARRMTGVYVFTEKDTDCAGDDPRAVLHTDAIAFGDYGPNCHGTHHEGPRFGGKHTGEFYKGVAPYQIPYGVLVPKEVDNLLVPIAASSSHVGFCALRLEPVWMSMGQAAGHAAHVSLLEGAAVQRVSVAKVQRLLHADGAGTIYVSDVPRASPEFEAVQWWGTQGGLHGLAKRAGKPGQRGKNIEGQYFEAFPQHAAELDKPLDEATRRRWVELAKQLNVQAPEHATTRGEFIRKVYASSHSQ